MNIRVKATDFQMTPETRAYLDERIATLQKLLTGSETIARVEVELGRDAGRPRHGANIFFAEMIVIVPGQERIYARNNSESVNGAIDDVKEEIERQLRREKQFHIRLYRRGGRLAKRLIRFGG
ncbi:ribosome-associated translation inhibitor RaiA [Candidatus Kaiserbacteria bacterium]|nr:ribosome-associated translation inhibitor RaiA [Candidatus Kaiserbacteria bacterium]